MTASNDPTGPDANDDVPPSCDDHEPRNQPLGTVDPDALERAARMFHAVGEQARLRLLVLLSHGEACVSELAETTGDGLSTISQRLRVLHQERLVSRRREGKHVFYALSDDHVANLILNALEHALEG